VTESVFWSAVATAPSSCCVFSSVAIASPLEVSFRTFSQGLSTHTLTRAISGRLERI
jgi:hypothetical protein